MITLPGEKRKLVCRVKSPADVRISPVTGPGRQFEAGGVNYEPRVHTAEEGAGRVEITAHGERVEFIVEMEITYA